jgi:hypothetical protein
MLSAGQSGNIQTNNHRREVGPDQAVAVGPREVVVLSRERLWVNPDCGLETRRWEEVLLAPANIVEAPPPRRSGCPRAADESRSTSLRAY